MNSLTKMLFAGFSDRSEGDGAMLLPENVDDKEEYCCDCCCHEQKVYQRSNLPRSRCLSFEPHTLVAIFMVTAIMGLLILVLKPVHSEDMILGAQEVASPTFSTKEVIFKSDKRFIKQDVFTNTTALYAALENWITLSTSSRGFIAPPKSLRSTASPDPYEGDPLSAGETKPMYMVTVFHQLHCLSYLIQYFASNQSTPQVHKHMAHCFDYLRQGIMCAADVTLEGKTEDGDGWGSRHVCRDYDQVRLWAERQSPWEFDQVGEGGEAVDVVGNGHL